MSAHLPIGDRRSGQRGSQSPADGRASRPQQAADSGIAGRMGLRKADRRPEATTRLPETAPCIRRCGWPDLPSQYVDTRSTADQTFCVGTASAYRRSRVGKAVRNARTHKRSTTASAASMPASMTESVNPKVWRRTSRLRVRQDTRWRDLERAELSVTERATN